MTGNSQKFLARNRAPRVQIEYDVELYGSEKKVQLPFVMGVMSDLAGKSKVPQPTIEDRSFLEIDVDNFDERMRAMAPRAAFSVPNTLTGEGNIAVDLTFEKMDDFSPAAIAAKVDSLRPLLEARTQLSDLMAYMDGKAGAESLIEKILADPTLLSAVSSAAEGTAKQGAALDSLRALTPEDTPEQDTTSDVLADLKANAPEDMPEQNTSGDALAHLASQVVEDAPDDNTADVALEGLRAAAPQEEDPDTSTQDTLAALAENEPQEAEDDNAAADALNSLANVELPEEVADTTDELLAGLADAATEPEEEPDTTDALLADLAAGAPDSTPEPDAIGDALDSLADAELAEAVEDTTDELLADLAEAAPEPEIEHDTTADALETLAGVEIADEAEDEADDLLADLAASAPDSTPEPDAIGDALDSLADVELAEAVEDNTDELLADLVETAPEGEAEPDTMSDALESLAEVDLPEEAEDVTDDLLADLVAGAPDTAPETDSMDDALDSLADVELPESVEDGTDELLANLAVDAPESEIEPDTTADVLEGLADVDLPDEAEDTTDDLLADMIEATPQPEADPDTTADALESLADLGLPEEGEDSTDALLADLAEVEQEPEQESDTIDEALDSLADITLPEEEEDTTDGLLAELAEAAPEPDVDPDIATGILDSLADAELPDEEEDSSSEVLENLAEEGVADDTADLDDLLGDLGASEDDALDDILGDGEADDTGDLDNLLDDLGGEDDNPDTLLGESEVDETSDLDDLLGDLGDLDDDDSDSLDALLGGGDDQAGDADDLDDLLGDLGGDDDDSNDALLGDAGDDDTSDLDDLLDDLGGDGDDDLDALPGDTGDDDTSDLDDLLGDMGGDGDLDDLLGDLDDTAAPADDPSPEATLTDEPEFAYGQMSAERPEPEKLNRKRFRLAILGDFSGRAAQGQLETGDALAARKPILLDPDTAEDVIEGFATDLVLPIGKDGAGVAVKLGGLDDLHPDELYENVDLFAELVGLRGQLSSGATAENAAKQLLEWGEKHGQHVAPTQARSSGNTVRADFKLSDFQKLIGDTGATLTEASPLDDLMARIVGPHIRAIPDADAMAMQGAVDEALSAAMRLVLHHPEFQSVEAQWRSIDLIARNIETDDTLDVILYDVSAEEIAADLVASDDLSQSGFARLLTEDPLDEENGRGGYSALIGLYTFEETPPHAELLGRIARLAAHVDAPFFTAITPSFLDTPKEERHKLVAEAWDTLRAMPEAGHLGLVSPRFLLRRPYGAKSEPIYEFEFEEFTMAEGLKGMLWANPVVLVAILLAKSFRENGASMSLGSIMSLGEMPYHYVNDRFGDQVALPCTERNLTLDKIEMAVTRGIMSVASIKGRDEIRLTSFGSLAGGEILGPWTGAPPPKPSPPKPEPAGDVPEILDSDDGSGDDMDLDDLLADFGDDPDLGGDVDDTDAELAALLGDL